MQEETKTESAKRTITLARALKEKERIARRLAQVKELFAGINRVRPDETREADVEETYAQMQALQKEYVALKKAIAVANAGISPSLVEMLAVRSELAFYTNLRCKEFEINDEYRPERDGCGARERVKIVYDTFINEKARREILDNLTKRLDDLQDEVDNFNATHFVEMVA